MKTQYYTASSLDGFIADAQHSLDWLFQFDASVSSYSQFLREVGAIAMGSSTYEWILRQHQPATGDYPQTWVYEQPTWVFSSRPLPQIAGADIHFVQGAVQPVHADMAKAAGNQNIWLVGGGELVGQFFDADLLDEIIVQIAAVTLGSGAPLLPRAITTPPLKLLSVQTYGNALVEVRYEVGRSRA